MNRNTSVIVTVATAVLCGCPGLIALCWGGVAALVSFIPGSNIDIGGSSDPQSALIAGLGSLCVGVIFIAIPIVVGMVTLRKKPQLPVDNEPIPPAS